MEAVECGAACLAIVLGYYRRFERLDTLRAACGVSRDGSNAGSIIRVAQQFGCEAEGFQASADAALKGPFPAIIFWNFNHFVVLEGASATHAYLNDPAIGHYRVSRSEFEERYSDVVISVSPGPAFRPGGKPERPLRRLLQQGLAYRAQMVFVLLVGVLIAFPTFIVPNIAGAFVDEVLIGGQASWLRGLIATLIAITLCQTLLAWLKNGVLLRVESHMAASTSASVLWHVLRLPSAFFSARYLGDITSRIASVPMIARVLSFRVATACVSFVMAVILFALMVLLDGRLAAIAIGGALVNVAVLFAVQHYRFETALRLSVDEGKLFGISAIGLRTIETLKAGGREDDFFGKWAGTHARILMAEQKLARIDQISALVPGLTITLTTALILWVGGGLVIEAALTLGALIAFQALLYELGAPLQQVANTAGLSQKVAADMARLDDILNHKLDWRHSASPQTDTGAPEAISLTLEGVTFGYNPLAQPLVEGFDLHLKKGEWVALVGGSGSGKTTIGKLACGLLEPWSGSVRIAGRALTSLNRSTLSGLMASVDQDIVLFEGSMRDNLTLWDPTISQEALMAAARDAHLFDVISSRSGSFETVVEENGRNFSGGERQRIELARALAREPALLILDEATSALDPETELQIMTAMRSRGMTCLVIAHRLSAIRDCDEIIVMDGGRVVERGSHDQLLANEGIYSRLIRSEDG